MVHDDINELLILFLSELTMVSDEVALHNISKSNVNLLVVLYKTIVLSQRYVQVAVHEKIFLVNWKCSGWSVKLERVINLKNEKE